jgi:general stress protein YciG
VLISKGRTKGGKHRAKQLGKEGYQEMGKKGGLSSSGESPEEKGVPIDESKFRTKS